MTSAARFVLPAVLSLGLASCSSMPFGGEETFADRLDEISDNYRDGQKDIRKGRDLVEDGRSDLKKQRERRQRELAGLTEAEQDIRLTREEITRVSASGGRPETLKELGDRIGKLQKRAEEHREEAQDAADDIRDAERKIARGERMIEEGEKKVAEARRRYYDDTGQDIDELASR